MNIEDFVTYEQALALKKLGFKEECLFHYCKNVKIYANSTIHNGDEIEISADDFYNVYNLYLDGVSDAPTLAQAQKWLREVKHYHINPVNVGNNKWAVIVDNLDNSNYNKVYGRPFDSYEEALSAGITEYLKMLND